MTEDEQRTDAIRAAVNRVGARAVVDMIAEHGNEYAGIPYAIEGETLIVHPSYKFADIFKKPEREEDPDWQLVNHFPSGVKPGTVLCIWKHRTTGKIQGGLVAERNRLTMIFNTFGVAAAWDVKVEAVAVNKLARMVKHHTFRHYMLTGAFLETSKRSGLTYMFRRLRPTLALSTTGATVRCIAALCLHPIGYYDGTWGGAMVPTDEVVAHLTLMRGDEADFWRQANQHPACEPGAGI